MTTEYYLILLPLALILIFSKIFSKLSGRLGLPGVVGILLAGLLIGFIQYIPNQTVFNDTTMMGLGTIAKIGVVLLLFSAGLETDVKQIKAVGLPSIIITAFGVIVPMALGFGLSMLLGEGEVISSLFYGVILTATSVSVTVATLREMGKLNSKAGTTIITAAVLDDIIGVVVLSFVIALKGTGGKTASPLHVLLMIVLFFIFMGIAGTLASRFFNFLEQKFPHHRLLAIFSVGFCFLAAFVSEKWFGVADITGAFVAGMFLSNNPEAEYIDRKADIMSYMIFTPVFFCNIGITTRFTGMNTKIILFGALLVVLGMLGKLIGCGVSALACRYSFTDALSVGIGMMARAEVALVSAQKGVEHGLVSSEIMPFIVILIIVTSLITPIALKKAANRLEKIPEAAKG